MPAEPPKPLDYAPGAPVRRKSLIRRITAICLVLLVLGVAGLLWPAVSKRARLYYWGAQCARWTSDTGQLAGSFSQGQSDRMSVPVAWINFYSLLSPPGLASRGTLLLHKLRSPGGTERLVGIDLYTLQNSAGVILLSIRSIDPGTFLHPPADVAKASATAVLVSDSAATTVRVFCARLDPSDSAHFSFDYSVDNNDFTRDGWLLDDGTVKLPGPTPKITPPVPASAGLPR